MLVGKGGTQLWDQQLESDLQRARSRDPTVLAAMAEDSGTSKSTFEVHENDGELTIGFSDDWVGRGGGDRICIPHF